MNLSGAHFGSNGLEYLFQSEVSHDLLSLKAV